VIEPLSLDLVAKACGVKNSLSGMMIERVSTDSRSIKAGDCFVALVGERFDGHGFLDDVLRKGASVAVVEKEDAGCSLPQLVVQDSTRALASIANLNRENFEAPLIGVTGSAGKTTVKEMLREILSRCGSVLATRGNLNNHIGVPLMLLELEQEHHYAVIEMGASAPDEVGYLAAVARPTVSVVTNVSTAHLEGFGSLDVVAETKGQIYRELVEDGVMVVNLDEQYSKQWRRQYAGKRIVTFSRHKTADVQAQDIALNASGCYQFLLAFDGKTTKVRLPLPGEHNVSNALAAAACCCALDIGLEEIAGGLESMKPVDGRMCMTAGIRDTLVLDDTYNASPESVRVAVDVLVDMAAQGGRASVMVFGGMAELGNATAEGFPGAEVFESRDDLKKACRELADVSSAVLFKGSRSAAMEEFVSVLTEASSCC
jgi:UDP-N-acetylmuramoyl-tripeptide--D-alanyl-D-alanine ligase